MTIQTFEDVVAWQKGKQLYVGLYKDLTYCRNLAYKDQILRATLSITNNIAEGFDRGSNKELKQFLIIARGSAAEVRSMLLMAGEIRALSEAQQAKYLNLARETSALLTGFIKSVGLAQVAAN